MQESGLSSFQFVLVKAHTAVKVYEGAGIGDIVASPEWDPDPDCFVGFRCKYPPADYRRQQGLVGIRNTSDGWHYMNGGYGGEDGPAGAEWLVVKVSDADLVDVDYTAHMDEKTSAQYNKTFCSLGHVFCKFRRGQIVFRGGSEELSRSGFADVIPLSSKCAYYWAKEVGNRDLMFTRMVDDKMVLFWAMDTDLCDNDTRLMLRDRINEQWAARLWGIFIGDREIMRSRIVDQVWIDSWNASMALFPKPLLSKKLAVDSMQA
jgi:hypothetical protein